MGITKIISYSYRTFTLQAASDEKMRRKFKKRKKIEVYVLEANRQAHLQSKCQKISTISFIVSVGPSVRPACPQGATQVPCIDLRENCNFEFLVKYFNILKFWFLVKIRQNKILLVNEYIYEYLHYQTCWCFWGSFGNFFFCMGTLVSNVAMVNKVINVIQGYS